MPNAVKHEPVVFVSLFQALLYALSFEQVVVLVGFCYHPLRSTLPRMLDLIDLPLKCSETILALDFRHPTTLYANLELTDRH